MTIVALAYTALMFVIYLSSKKVDRFFLFVFLGSGFYYCVLGPLYWVYYEGGSFLGENWRDEIPWSMTVLSAAVLVTSCFVVLLSRVADRRRQEIFYDLNLGLSYKILEVLGVVGAAYVTLTAVIGGAGFNKNDPLILIAYQFSDLLIPVVLFGSAVSGFNKSILLKIGLFFFYASLVGYRYKIVLMVVPLAVVYMSYVREGEPKGRIVVRRVLVSVFSFVLISFLSVMTLVRSKFDGLDFSKLDLNDVDALLYSFFAESNIIFGMVGVMRSFVDKGVELGFVPVYDAFKELVPRVFFQSRETGAYLYEVLGGLLSEEALNSGTAYPFVGEYLIMGGYFGAWVGCCLFAIFYYLLRSYLAKRTSQGGRIQLTGLGLIAVFFGYYYFSRGYFPQAIKGVLFVVLPYLFLVGTTIKRRLSS